MGRTRAGRSTRRAGVGCRRVAVELVVDVPDQLLQQVLDGHDAFGAAVLVDHDRQGLAFGLHASQGVQDPHRLGQGQGRPEVVGDPAAGVDQVDQVGDLR